MLLKRRKFTEHHAQTRFVQRTRCPISFSELKELIEKGDYQVVVKQSCTRSLCLAKVGVESIWFVMNRKTKSVITILTAKQARNWVGAEAEKGKESEAEALRET